MHDVGVSHSTPKTLRVMALALAPSNGVIGGVSARSRAICSSVSCRDVMKRVRARKEKSVSELLYLALDNDDDRPLIIDQPEENLDPKSVYDELVPLFQAAKRRRQVIMVTHNANLVVNTDADQIIVAEVGTPTGGGLPPIRYESGGLDERRMRKLVCDILEGGELAFRDRARRLRIALAR